MTGLPIPAHRPKQERGERRRELILVAATASFLANGFAGTSLDEVVRIAGGSRRDIYAWFGNKEALFGEVIGRACNEILESLSAGTLHGVEPREALTAFGLRFARVVTSPHVIALHRVVVAESPRFPELGKAFFRAGPGEAYALLASALETWADQGLIRIDDAALEARIILEGLKGDLQDRALFSGEVLRDEEIERSVQHAIGFFFDGLRIPRNPAA